MNSGATSTVAALCAALLLVTVPGSSQEDGPASKSKGLPKGGPVPRTPYGKPNFDVHPGVWDVRNVRDISRTAAFGGKNIEVPVTAKTQQILDERKRTVSAGDPEGYCLPPGVPRMMYTPYPMKIIQLPDRWYMIFEGGAHVWREIPIGPKEKLTHPEDPNPTYLGDAYGYWEGDDMVIDVVGFNDRTWLDYTGHPHGEKLHVVERYKMLDFLNMEYTATIEDPEFYTKPWSFTIVIPHSPEKRIMEYICQENERDSKRLEQIHSTTKGK